MMDSSFDSGDDLEPTEIVSIDDYDKKKAKFQASLLWTLSKAYNGEIPSDYKELFYEDKGGTWTVQPRVVNLLTSGQAYCLVCGNCFQDAAAAKWQDHSSVIQALSRKGIYVVDNTDTPVTETCLMQRTPFKTAAHLAMMDALMRAYAGHVFSLQHVVGAVRRFAPVAASSELPDDTEGAAMFWVNKVCGTVKTTLTPGQEDVCIPMLEDLVKDIGDCCCLDTLVSFYCPEQLKFEDICLQDNVAIADSLHNASLLKKFCHHQLPHVLHLSYNDLLYTNTALSGNILALLADLFYSFELKRIPCVRAPGMKAEVESEPAVDVAKVMSQVPPISAATKRSFHQSNQDQTTHSNTDLSTRAPLLDKRVLLSERCDTADSPKPPDQPTEAWLTNRSDRSDTGERKEPSPSASDPVHRTYTKSALHQLKQNLVDQSQPGSQTGRSEGKSGGSLLTNVSLDSDLSTSFGDEARMSDSDLDIPRPSSFKEPLLPAKLKPAKEKWSVHTKEVESGEKKEKSPTSPGRGKVQKQYSSSDEEFATPSASGHTTPFSGSPEHAMLPSNGSTPRDRQPPPVSQSPVTSAVTSEPVVTNQNGEQMVKTIASEVSVAPAQTNGTAAVTHDQSRDSESVTSHDTDQSRGVNSVTSDRQDGFYIRGDSDTARPLHRRNGPTPQTFTINDSRSSPRPPADTREAPQREAPQREAPQVIGTSDSGMDSKRNDSRSSGEFSDHESSKIHKDHKLKEANGGGSFYLSQDSSSTESNLKSGKSPDEISPTTSFAQIKKQRETTENGGPGGPGGQEVVVMAQYESDSPLRTSLKSQFQKTKDVKKKTSFALPNQTTWQENAQKTMQRSDEKESDSSNSGMSVSDLSSVRLKLEAKRKMMEMEKKKAEAKLASQRQKLGKEAFLQVVGRKGPKSEEGQGERPSPADRQFSREGIQSKIDGVKQRWFKDESASEGSGDSRVGDSPQRTVEHRQPEPRVPDPRPERYEQRPESRPEPKPEPRVEHRAEPRVETRSEPRVDPRAERAPSESRQDRSSSSDVRSTVSGSSEPRSGSSEPRTGSTDSYDSSFERLNASLSDLQGEILKLNLQQEQITKTITTPRTVAQEVKPEVPRPQQQYPYMMPGYTGDAYDPNNHIPAPGMPGYPGMMPHTVPGGQYPYAGMYPNHYNMYQRPYMGQGHLPGHLPGTLPGQLGHMPGTLPGQHVPGMGYPVSTAYHPGSSYPGVAGVTSSPSHLDPLSRIRTTTPIPHSTQYSPSHPGVGQPISAQSPQQQQATPTKPPSPAPPREEPGSPMRPAGRPERQVSVPGSPRHPTSPETSPDDVTPPKVGPASGFVITFDDGAPKRSKPKLRQKNERDKSQERTPKKEPKTSDYSPPAATPALPVHDMMSKPAGSSFVVSNTLDVSVERPEAKPSPPAAGFVVAIEQTEEEEEIQRKKDKIMQMAMKRQADMERKRAEKEQAAAKAREEKRLAKELVEQKKQEEKARRAEIFEAYKNKKRADDDDAPPPARPKPPKPRASRPQRVVPPGVLLDDKQSVCSSQGSQEDLHMNRSTSPGSSNGSRKGSVPNHFGYAKDDCMTSPSSVQPSTNRRAESPGQFRSGLYRSQSALLLSKATHRNESRKGFQRPLSMAGQDNGMEYSGPKLFVKPKSKSNKSVIHNAISHCCLAGTVGGDYRNTVLDELGRCESNYYLILFRDAGCQFRALYRYNPDIEDIVKLIGSGPKQINGKMLDRFYKYNSGSKCFSEVKTTKHLSVSIDAVTIQGHLWQAKRPVSTVIPGRRPSATNR